MKTNSSKKNKDILIPPNIQTLTHKKIKKFQQQVDIFHQKSWGGIKHTIVPYIMVGLSLIAYLKFTSNTNNLGLVLLIINNSFFKLILIIVLFLFFIYMLRLVAYVFIGREKIFSWKNTGYIIFESIFCSLLLPLFWAFTYFLKFPIINQKEILGVSVLLGLFIVVNTYLVRKRYKYINTNSNAEQRNIEKEITRITSIRTKVSVLILSISIIASGIFVFIGYKYMLRMVLLFQNNYEYDESIKYIKDSVVLLGILLVLVYSTSMTYFTNTKLFLMQLTMLISNIFHKNYNQEIFPFDNDELGIMSENLNMITHKVRRREHTYSIFGKYIAPEIADRIIDYEDIPRKGGAVRETVIMHSDIRNIKHYINTHEVNQTVLFINKYFTDIKRIVEQFGGILNKTVESEFIALYGLNDKKIGINNAVYAACAIQEHFLKIKSKFQICTGIGVGLSIVGLMGPSDELEFTTLGGNTQSSKQLQFITSKMDMNIAIDDTAYHHLQDDLKKLPWKKIEISLKDNPSIIIYGLKIHNNASHISIDNNFHIIDNTVEDSISETMEDKDATITS